MFTSKKVALGAGAAAVALGLSLGATSMASAATTTPAPTATSSATAGTAAGDDATTDAAPHEGRGGHGHRGGIDAAELASQLDLDEATVTEALETARDAARDSITAEGEKPDRAALESAVVAALAETLGVEEAAVRTAVDELEAAEQAERSAAVQEKLEAAVADGSLTQAEADGAAKAVELGLLGGGRG